MVDNCSDEAPSEQADDETGEVDMNEEGDAEGDEDEKRGISWQVCQSILLHREQLTFGIIYGNQSNSKFSCTTTAKNQKI